MLGVPCHLRYRCCCLAYIQRSGGQRAPYNQNRSTSIIKINRWHGMPFNSSSLPGCFNHNVFCETHRLAAPAFCCPFFLFFFSHIFHDVGSRSTLLTSYFESVSLARATPYHISTKSPVFTYGFQPTVAINKCEGLCWLVRCDFRVSTNSQPIRSDPGAKETRVGERRLL